MKTLEQIIMETFEIIPDGIFENKHTEKSIYINLETKGYKHDWSGKVFTTKSGKKIRYYEIKHNKIKPTKAETIANLTNEYNRMTQELRELFKNKQL